MPISKTDTGSNIGELIGGYSTNTERLAVINDAIYKVLVGGQSYKIGSKSLTRADLEVLIAERDKIEAAIKSEKTSGLLPGVYAADFGYDNRR